MSTRILVTLEDDADPDEVVRALHDAGAQSVTPPQPELPGVAIATFEVDDLAPRIASIQLIPGVSVAEADAWRETSRVSDSPGDDGGAAGDDEFDLGVTESGPSTDF